MKVLIQPGKSFGSAASSAPAQRKGGLKTITDNRPTAIAQRKLQVVSNSSRQTIHLQQGRGTIQMKGIRTNVIQREIDEAEFTQISTLAESIRAQYPTDEYYYLGLGKSPTPIIAYMQALSEAEGNEAEAKNMPLSKFGHKLDSMSREQQLYISGDELNEEQNTRLSAHFDSFVPTAAELRGRKILLIDFVQSGKSLVATRHYLERYLEQRDQRDAGWASYFSCLPCFSSAPRTEVTPLALAIAEQQEKGSGNRKTMDALGLSETAIMIPGSLDKLDSLAARMGAEEYKPSAEYPEDFKISSPDRPESRSIVRDAKGRYKAIKSELAEHIRRKQQARSSRAPMAYAITRESDMENSPFLHL